MEPPLITHAAIVRPITESSQIGEARRAIVHLAGEVGLSADECARVGLIVTELGTNLVKHARDGEIIARSLANEGGVGVIIHSVDQGPGMANLDECLRDGFSTAGSSGIGLGALRRKASTFHIYSLEQVGTVIATTVVASPPPAAGLDTGLVIAPISGEVESGDCAAVVRHGTSTTFIVADGLGHGPQAADASNEAVRVVRESPSKSPSSLMLLIHDALKKTRGAAVAIVTVDSQENQLSFCGVGNISTSLVHYGYSKTLATGNGIVGHILPRIETITMPWTGRDLIMMHSDGLHTHNKTLDQPGLLVRPVSIIAGMLYARQKRGRDDACILVARASDS